MQTYAKKGIKDIIEEFPGVGKILEEYGIGCGLCTIGICQLKDILDIHKLSREGEEELMRRIEAEVYPERNIAITTCATLNPASFASSMKITERREPLSRKCWAPSMQKTAMYLP